MASLKDVVNSITVTCDMVRATAPDLKERSSIWQRQGFSGYGAQKLGDGRAELVIIAVEFDTLENITTWRGKIEALQSKMLQVVNDRAETHNNIFCFQIDNPRVTRADVTPGTVGYRAKYEMLCIRTAAD